MCSGFDGKRLGLELHAGRIGLRHAPVDIEQRDALAVDGEFDLLIERRRRAVQLTCRNSVEIHCEDVFAVRGERVHDGDAAACTDRRPLDLFGLRRKPRQLVRGGPRARLRIADRETTDRTRRIEIRVEQRRTRRLDVGNVVEVRALRVERQPVAGVHVEREQFLDRRFVFDAVQALERAPTRIRVRGCRLIDEPLERRGELRERVTTRSRAAGRWHHARAQLVDDLLGDFGILRRFGNVES